MKKILVTYNMFREGFIELENKYQVNFPVTQELGTDLQIIANYTVSYDNINIAYTKYKGIFVTNTPDPVINPTANLALSLLLACE